MNFKPIIIIGGEPQSIFLEIFVKVTKRKFRYPIILISSKKILKKNIVKFKKNFKYNELNKNFSNIKRGKLILLMLIIINLNFQ